MTSDLVKLETYSRSHPQEVLIVKLQRQNSPTPDEVMIYKGFTSALSFATDPDPDMPVVSADAEMLSIDRYHAPYHPRSPRPIQINMTWSAFSGAFL